MIIGKFNWAGATLILIQLICSIGLSAQQDNLQKATEAYDNDQFHEAIIYYNQVEKLPQSGPLLLKRGICYYEINQLDNALEDFRKALEFGYDNDLIDYYTGSIYHHRGEFAKAANYYKKYLSKLSETSPERRRLRKLIKQCGHAINISYQKPIAIVDNPSKKINSIYDDVGAIHSPSYLGRLYYSSNRPNVGLSMRASDFDIYYIDQNESAWGDPKRLPSSINRGKDEIILGFTNSANGVYFYRETNIGGEILLNGTATAGSSRKMGLELPLTSFNKRMFYWNDEVIFVSLNLPEGYGGYDLYAVKKEGKDWSAPINLGASINTADDELSPFLSADGRTIYFSSNREYSIGGFDVYRSNYLYESDSWSVAMNVGIPINSAGDELDFELSFEGLTAIFSSNRKNGLGAYDIYVARFKERLHEQNFVSEDLGFIQYTASNMVEVDESHTISEDWLTLENISEDSSFTVRQPIELEIPYLYYIESSDVNTTVNTHILDKVGALLQADSELSLEIIGHSGKLEIPEFSIFSSIKTAERAQQYLVERGIDRTRILTKGTGYNYPLIKNQREGGDDALAEKYNARIEFRVHGPTDREVRIVHTSPDLAEDYFSLKAMLYETLVYDELSYKIRLITMGQMYRGKLLSLYNDATVERDPDTGLYLYTIGLYDTFAKALQVSRDLERDGWVDVSVIPYLNGRRMVETDLVFKVNEYQDLRNYMNYKD